MPRKRAQKKAEVRVFLDGVHLKLIDDLIGVYGNTRSEVIRTLIQDWLSANIRKLKELRELGKEAKRGGYVTE